MKLPRIFLYNFDLVFHAFIENKRDLSIDFCFSNFPLVCSELLHGFQDLKNGDLCGRFSIAISRIQCNFIAYSSPPHATKDLQRFERFLSSSKQM